MKAIVSALLFAVGFFPTMVTAKPPVLANAPQDATAQDVENCRPLGEIIGETPVCVMGGKARARRHALEQSIALGATHIIWLGVRCHIGVGEKARARVFSCAPTASLASSYEDYLVRDASLGSRTIASTVSPEVRKSVALDNDVADLESLGFVLIGYAGTSGTPISLDEITRKAVDVAASKVLVHTSVTEAVEYQSVTTYSQSGPGISFSTGTGSGSTYGRAGGESFSASTSVHGSSTSISMPQGETAQHYVPFSRRQFDSQILFWRKRAPGPFGIYGEAIPPRLRAALRRNTGVMVVAVEEGSPAFLANLLVGDVVIRIGDTEIRSPSDLAAMSTTIATSAGLPVVILRDGKETTIKL